MSENIRNNAAAGIDIGSNSIRMLIACARDGKISRFLYSDRITTRLAANIGETGALSPGPFEKSISVLKKFKNAIDRFEVSKIKAVATSAVREASNGEDFIKAAANIGVNVEIITGEEEASLVYSGVKAGIDTGRSPLIFDAGGGSTEFIAARSGSVLFAKSIKIGVVKMADMFNMKDRARENIGACACLAADFFRDIRLPEGNERLIATAGSATTAAAIDAKMKKYDWQKVNGHTMTKDKIEEILSFIAQTPYKERINIPGMEKGREDVIIPGIIIILEIMKKTGFDKITVSDFGLREGAVVAAAAL